MSTNPIYFLEENQDIKVTDVPLYLALIIICCLSLLFTLSVIIFSIVTKTTDNPNFFATINLLISSMLHSLGYAFNYVKDGNPVNDSVFLCHGQAFLAISLSLSMDIWVCIISYRNYQMIILDKDISQSNDKFTNLVYSLIAYLPPIVLFAILEIVGVIGKTNINYWIAQEHYISGISVYVPRIICLVIIIFFGYKLIIQLIGDEGKKSDKFFYFGRTAMYPIIQALNIIIPFFFFIFNLKDDDDDSKKDVGILGQATLILGGIVGFVYPAVFLIIDIINIGIEKAEQDIDNHNFDSKPTLMLDTGESGDPQASNQ